MPSELEAAVERLRFMLQANAVDWVGMEPSAVDLWDVAREYMRLADPTPMDEAWLIACGLGSLVYFGEQAFGCERGVYGLQIIEVAPGEWMVDFTYPDGCDSFDIQRVFKSRGQVRMLAKALGIELAE